MIGRTRNRAVEWGAGVVLASLATYFAWLIVTRSGDPRSYFENRHEIDPSWSYPGSAVVVSCLLMVAEAVVLWLVMCKSRSPFLWRRALACVLVTLPPALLGAVLLMHSPPYFGFHILWIESVAAVALVTLMVTALARSYMWLIARSGGSG